MIRVIGITGGIGSGKSTISNMLRGQGYVVFDCDAQAKHICNHDIYTIIKIKENFGENIYVDEVLDRKALAKIVFNDKGSLDTLNSIIHPKTRDYMCGAILDNMDQEVLFVESAIMFETGLNEFMDFVITVTAPKDIRIQRVISRDNTTKDKIEDRMNNQMDEKDRMSKSDYVLSTNQSLDEVENRLCRMVDDIKTRILL